MLLLTLSTKEDIALTIKLMRPTKTLAAVIKNEKINSDLHV